MYWQEKAWADPALTRQWLLRSMAKAIEGCPGEHLLLCDNLAGQDVRKTAGKTGRATKELAESIGVRVWNLLAGSTDEVQVRTPLNVSLEEGSRLHWNSQLARCR